MIDKEFFQEKIARYNNAGLKDLRYRTLMIIEDCLNHCLYVGISPNEMFEFFHEQVEDKNLLIKNFLEVFEEDESSLLYEQSRNFGTFAYLRKRLTKLMAYI